MRVGILGSGLMGAKLGTIFARAGHDVVFSYARSRQKLEKLARDAGGKARAGTPAEAADGADTLLLAVHWLRFDDVLWQAGDLSGKVILTCSLPMNADDTDLVVGRTSSAAEQLAKRLPRARIVSAFNTVPSEVLFGVYAARRRAKKRGVPIRVVQGVTSASGPFYSVGGFCFDFSGPDLYVGSSKILAHPRDPRSRTRGPSCGTRSRQALGNGDLGRVRHRGRERRRPPHECRDP